MCNNRECQELGKEISFIIDKAEIEKILINCEKCCHQKEKAPLKQKTYMEVRKKYVQLFWEEHRKKNLSY